MIDAKKMRACAPLLPEPGNEVVLELLDEIERLRAVLEAAKRVLYADSLPFPESRAQFDGAMVWLELAVEDATKAGRGGE